VYFNILDNFLEFFKIKQLMAKNVGATSVKFIKDHYIYVEIGKFDS
jgi:hypothetical protein